MSKHIMDRGHSTRPDGSARLKAYAGIDKSRQPSAASLDAQRVERERKSGARVEAFTRIERKSA